MLIIENINNFSIKYENKDMKILLDAARDISKEDMQMLIDMAKRFKGEK